jgi:hypothetical protein
VTLIPSAGQAYCESSYEGHLVVPNSKDEAAFIGNYLSGLMVRYLKIIVSFTHSVFFIIS